MTLVYACDDNYAKLTAVSAVSALRHNSGARIVLLGCNLKESSIELIRSRVLLHGGTFTSFDLTDRLNAIAEKGFSGYTSYAIYSRLFIADLLAEESGRILYLDCDTLILDSLDELFAIPMNGKPFAFGYDCIHSAYKRYVKISPNAPYYNSGVMLADLAAWRAGGATDLLKEEFAHPKGPNPLPDQDIINRAWRDLITPLPPRWNFLSQYFLFDYRGIRAVNGRTASWSTDEEYAAARQSPTICHFSGHTLGRPWFTSSKHPMRQLYIEASAYADLPEVAQQTRPMDKPYIIQYWLWQLLPQFLFNPIAQAMFRVHIRLTYGL